LAANGRPNANHKRTDKIKLPADRAGATDGGDRRPGALLARAKSTIGIDHQISVSAVEIHTSPHGEENEDPPLSSLPTAIGFDYRR
jgi:hypothetical protein